MIAGPLALFEELRRCLEVNNQICKVFSGGEGSNVFTNCKLSGLRLKAKGPLRWSEVKVGSFVKLFRDQPVPADLLLVYATSGLKVLRCLSGIEVGAPL